MENDGVREADENFRVAIDQRIVALYTEFGRGVPIIKGPLEARELAFREAINEVLTAISATAS
ncbi:hypothetical protein IVA86_00260 [Bradyrhizobium sp. 146]|uniref:hypothetical protein n=1 Tax=Bradyrhizobium sp. 146 TaxID=2782622 RepID=UPI001FF749BE|nr:hypothetical protein [Bradyrhizobium sp. 146]MCK1699911.1 hypothetical protein [Bradyrhizobium sp. 146]